MYAIISKKGIILIFWDEESFRKESVFKIFQISFYFSYYREFVIDN